VVSAANKAAAFRAMHAPGAPGLVLGNVSTPSMARMLQGQGYQALGTTSAGLADDLGLSDGEPDAESLLLNAAAIAQAVDLPVSADLENGRGATLGEVEAYYRRAAQQGLAGASIEDSVAPDGELFSIDEATDRLSAALRGARGICPDFVMTARTEVFQSPEPELSKAITRLQAYEAMGADVLFAPGLPLDVLDQLLSAISQPVNVLMTPADGARFPDLFARGVRRISLGAGLTRAALHAASGAAATALGAQS
jgi:2-methylisocitrate lyase-like PEP mutase family enzyme